MFMGNRCYYAGILLIKHLLLMSMILILRKMISLPSKKQQDMYP
jgi:hypothetical protein